MEFQHAHYVFQIPKGSLYPPPQSIKLFSILLWENLMQEGL